MAGRTTNLCKTNPILSASGGFQNALTLVITMTNYNEHLPAYGGTNYAKQTQSNPILPARGGMAGLPAAPFVYPPVAGRKSVPKYRDAEA